MKLNEIIKVKLIILYLTNFINFNKTLLLSKRSKTILGVSILAIAIGAISGKNY